MNADSLPSFQNSLFWADAKYNFLAAAERSRHRRQARASELQAAPAENNFRRRQQPRSSQFGSSALNPRDGRRRTVPGRRGFIRQLHQPCGYVATVGAVDFHQRSRRARSSSNSCHLAASRFRLAMRSRTSAEVRWAETASALQPTHVPRLRLPAIVEPQNAERQRGVDRRLRLLALTPRTANADCPFAQQAPRVHRTEGLFQIYGCRVSRVMLECREMPLAAFALQHLLVGAARGAPGGGSAAIAFAANFQLRGPRLSQASAPPGAACRSSLQHPARGALHFAPPTTDAAGTVVFAGNRIFRLRQVEEQRRRFRGRRRRRPR